MTKDPTEEILEKSKTAIKEEVDKIAKSISKVLLVGGPSMVEAILTSLIHTNKKIASQMNIKIDTNFEDEKNGTV